MNAYPFSIFKRADRSAFSVSFKDATGKYLRPISTGKKTEEEATAIAFMWLRDGIPQNKMELKVNDLSLKDECSGGIKKSHFMGSLLSKNNV